MGAGVLALLACASVARAQQTASGAIDSIRCGPLIETDISRDDAQNPAQDHFTFKEHRSTFHNHNNEAVTTVQTAIAEASMASLKTPSKFRYRIFASKIHKEEFKMQKHRTNGTQDLVAESMIECENSISRDAPRVVIKEV